MTTFVVIVSLPICTYTGSNIHINIYIANGNGTCTYTGNIAEHTMGIEYLQWKYNRTHNGNRIFTMGI